MATIKKRSMVGWYNPKQLARTGYQVFVSTIFGKYSDRRPLQAIATDGSLSKLCYFEVEGRDGQDFWFDYVADVGDGFNSTYTVAHNLAQPTLAPLKKSGSKDTEETRRGEILIFGGDEVYPAASFEEYWDRLVGPYKAAFPQGDETKPAVFAIPGNHDWYDNLNGCMSFFGRKKLFAGWQTYQNRSYFAIKLPAGWWLFGTDMQLASSIDNGQMDFFEKIVKTHVGPDDRIILCNAEPHWITRAMYPNNKDYNNRNMGYFEGHILAHKTKFYIAGDRHYYRHHQDVPTDGTPPSHKIVAGGGGAFLHPTHMEGVGTIGQGHVFNLVTSYPGHLKSWLLGCWTLLFPLWNPLFGLITAALYLITVQAFSTDLHQFSFGEWRDAASAVTADAVAKPLASFWTLVLIAGFIFFTDTKNRWYRWVGGPLHAAAQLIGVFVAGWAASYWYSDYAPVSRFFASFATVLAAGYLIAPTIWGFYLFFSLNFLGQHHNESMSASWIDGYKNFLRFKIAANGDLTIYPIGIRRPVRKWKKSSVDGKSGLIPVEPQSDSTLPFLIEPPIHYPVAKPGTGSVANATATTSGTPMEVVEHQL